MAAMHGSLSRSPVVRFFGVWFVTREKRITFAVLTAIFLLACLFTRIGRMNIKYAALNPVRDAGVWKRISGGDKSPEIEEMLRSGSLHHAETLYLPPPTILKILSLGYLENLSDLLFIRAHSYFLTHFFSDRIFNWLDLYVDRIISLDPDNPRVYLWAAQVVKYGQIIDNNIINKANSILEKGIERFPSDYRFYLDIGFNLFFEYKPADEAEAANMKEKALQYFAIASSLPGSKLDPNFVTELYLRKNETRLALFHAYEKYYEANDYEKEQLLRRIEEIEKGAAEDLKNEEERWKLNYPYIPVHLFVFVGEKRDIYNTLYRDELEEIFIKEKDD